MSARHHDDDDPTGMRHLLRGMSDPEPMSADLVRRIAEDIDREQQTQREPLQFDPAVDRPKRRAPRAAGAVMAIAGVALIALAVPAVSGFLQRTQAATTASLATALAAPGDAVAPTASAPAPVTAGSTGAADSRADHAVTVAATNTNYQRGALTKQARTLVDTAGADATAATSDPNHDEHSTVSAETVDSCLHALGLDHSPVLVDTATYEGEPALVIVGPPAHGDDRTLRTLAVMPRACPADVKPLTGPYLFH